MKIKYQVFDDENLLIQQYSGIFSIQEYQAYTSHIIEYITTKLIKKVLVDFREITFSDMTVQFTENLNKALEVRKKINENELKNKDIILVFWVNKPLPTVIAHLFSKNFKNYNYCSTKETIIEKLTLPEYFDDLESIINDLENTFY